MSKRIRGNYQKISIAEKQRVIELKDEGRTSSEIARILKINVKTVASIKQAERKCDSKEIKEVLMEAMRKIRVPNEESFQGNDLFEIRRNLRQHIRHEINNPDNKNIQAAIESYNQIKRKKFDPKNRKIIEWVTNQYMDEFLNKNQKVQQFQPWNPIMNQSFWNFLMVNQYKLPVVELNPTTGLKQFKPIITIKPS